ncbi:hypothetical protein B0H14DRAFT_3897841 [Mycena olivaceomarginata]|nr:hypothetical protein B0H14DRAFT_3897841 [Mycena olivaceomarginata]
MIPEHVRTRSLPPAVAGRVAHLWCHIIFWPIPPPLAYPADIRARRCSLLLRPLPTPRRCSRISLITHQPLILPLPAALIPPLFAHPAVARSPPPLDPYLSLAPPPLPLLAHLALLLLTYTTTPRSYPRCTRTPGCTHTSPPLVPTSPLLLSGCVPRHRFMHIPPLLMHPALRCLRTPPRCSSALDACPVAARSRATVASVPRRSPCSTPQPVLPATARTTAARLSRLPSCTPPLPACSMCTSLITYPIAPRTPLRRCMRTLLQLAHPLPAYFATGPHAPLPACSMCTSLITYPTATCTPSTPPRPAVAHRHSRRTACAVPTSSDARNLVGMTEGSDETQGDKQWQ